MITIPALLLLFLVVASLVVRARAIPSRVLIVGATPLARQLAAEIDLRHYRRHSVVGIVDDATAVDPPLAAALIGPLASLPSIIEERRPDRIVVTLADRRGRLPMRDLLEARVRGRRRSRTASNSTSG
jgi:FlaA1/EpsC-like NDP-sugar epimerase